MKNKKISLVIIILLIIVFLPLTALGIMYRVKNHISSENPKQEMYFNGYIWFYDNNKQLVGKYECLTEKCEAIKGVSESYIFSEKFAFITDGTITNLYDLQTNKDITKFSSVVPASIDNEDIFILKNEIDGNLALASFKGTLNVILPFDYQEIEVVENGYVVKQDDKWFVKNKDNTASSFGFEDKIFSFNDKYVATKGEYTHVYDYEGNRLLEDISIKDVIFKNDFVGIRVLNTLYIYKDLSAEYIKEVELKDEHTNLLMDIEDNKLIIKNAGETLDTIELS